MSGTRSHSRTAPATERPLLLIAAHGERGGAGDNQRLDAVAHATTRHLSGWDVVHGVLSGEPSIEQALKGKAGRTVLVWPFFLCDGYFVSSVLRSRLDAVDNSFVFLPEYGSNPELADLAIGKIGGYDRTHRDILVVGHGSSKGSQSRHATERIARHIQGSLRHTCVTCAYLDQTPWAGDAIPALPARSILVNLFAGDGLHGGRDIPKMIDGCGRNDIEVVNPARDTEAVARLAARAALASAGCMDP